LCPFHGWDLLGEVRIGGLGMELSQMRSHLQGATNFYTHMGTGKQTHTYPAYEIRVLWPFAVSRGMLPLPVCLFAVSCWLIYIFLVIKMCLYSTARPFETNNRAELGWKTHLHNYVWQFPRFFCHNHSSWRNNCVCKNVAYINLSVLLFIHTL